MTVMTAADTKTAREAALNNLDERWGHAYDLAITRAGWVAKRLDDGRALVAAGPVELSALITADDAPAPVARPLPAATARGQR